MTEKENLLWKIAKSLDYLSQTDHNMKETWIYCIHVKARKDIFSFLEETSIWITHNFK